MARKAKKKFDCVEMKRQGAERIRRATEGMTPEEELAFWQHGTKELLEQQRNLRREGHQQPPAHR